MTHIRQRGDTAANWTAADPVLDEREVGWETDTRRAKLGDGTTPWSLLPYAVQPQGSVVSVNGRGPDGSGNVTLFKSDIGLGNVNNTADAAKPISVAQQAYVDAVVATRAALASPTFTGDPKAPTPAVDDNDTSLATTAFVKAVRDQNKAAAAASGGSHSHTGNSSFATVATGWSVSTLTGEAVTFSAGVFTVTHAGWYTVGANLQSVTATAGRRIAGIFSGSGEVLRLGDSSQAARNAFAGAIPMFLAAGTALDLRCWADVATTFDNGRLAIVRLRA